MISEQLQSVKHCHPIERVSVCPEYIKYLIQVQCMVQGKKPGTNICNRNVLSDGGSQLFLRLTAFSL